VVAEEADEAVLWLELLTESGITKAEMTEELFAGSKGTGGDPNRLGTNSKKVSIMIFQLPNYSISQFPNA
jgi:hypothetical protein